MELSYDLLVSAFTALCLSFLVAKLVSLALSTNEATGVDNGSVDEGKKSRAGGSKSKKKRIKKTSSESKGEEIVSPIEVVGVENEEGVISDGEEWEGIDRNELERDFAKAMSFVERAEKEGGWLDDVIVMQFHGLHKAAMEGNSLDEPTLSARAMWNAWPKFGSMNPEEAMEKYITLLSEKVPGWMDLNSSLEGKMKSEEDEACGSSETNSTCTYESKPGVKPATWTDDLAGRSSSMNKDEE